MKVTKSHRPFQHILSYVLISVIAISVISCARKTSFLTSPVVPAARGDVTVKSDKNKNYVIHVQLSGLAEVERLQPSKNAYVVWMETDRNVTKNLGQITSSSGTFSQNLKASFETVSSEKPTKIFITAENDPSIQYPGTQVVLSTDRF